MDDSSNAPDDQRDFGYGDLYGRFSPGQPTISPSDLYGGVDTSAMPFAHVMLHLAAGADPADLEPQYRHIVPHAQMFLQPAQAPRYGVLGRVTGLPSLDDEDTAGGSVLGNDLNENIPEISATTPEFSVLDKSQAGVGEIPSPRAQITAAQLQSIFSNASRETVDRYVDSLNRMFDKEGIDDPEQRAAFLGQVVGESPTLQGREGTSFSTFQRLNGAHPSAFPTPQSAEGYLHNPQGVANRAYAGRNGNGQEDTGDGYRYRGGGLLQITGRANYRAAGLEHDPEDIENPQSSADASGSYWSSHNMNNLVRPGMSRSQYDQITRAINGGLMRANERWLGYRQARQIFGLD